VEDGGMAFMVTEDGVSIVIEVSWGLYIREGHHYLNVYGSSGSAHLNPFVILIGEGDRTVDRTPILSKSRENIFIESYRHEMEYFAEVLKGRVQPPPLEEQVVLHRVIDAIYESARTGSEVSLG